MGGTTAKASVIVGHEVAVTADYEVGGAANAKRWMHGTGHPIRVPVIDLAEVSAGGGSIAWVDPGGSLKVRSAQRRRRSRTGGVWRGRHAADGHGRRRRPGLAGPRGVAGPRGAAGRDLKIDLAAAERAIATGGGGAVRADGAGRRGAHRRGGERNMAQALRIVSVERGHDPREFSLIAFGGAGPVHAVALAEELPIPEVIIPPAPGAFSALGLVATDLKRDYAQTLYADLGSVDPACGCRSLSQAMERAGAAMLEAAVAPAERRALPRLADVRYRRQAYELTLPVADGPVTRESLDRLAAAFHDEA